MAVAAHDQQVAALLRRQRQQRLPAVEAALDRLDPGLDVVAREEGGKVGLVLRLAQVGVARRAEGDDAHARGAAQQRQRGVQRRRRLLAAVPGGEHMAQGTGQDRGGWHDQHRARAGKGHVLGDAHDGLAQGFVRVVLADHDQVGEASQPRQRFAGKVAHQALFEGDAGVARQRGELRERAPCRVVQGSEVARLEGARHHLVAMGEDVARDADDGDTHQVRPVFPGQPGRDAESLRRMARFVGMHDDGPVAHRSPPVCVVM